MKRLLIVLFLCSVCRGYVVDKPIMGVQLNRGHSLSRGLVGIWLFNDQPGVVGRTYDLAGNGRQGTLVVNTHSVPGKFGPALGFDGVIDHVLLPQVPELDGASAASIIFWVKHTTVGNNQFLFKKGTDTAIWIVFFMGAAGTLAVDFDGTAQRATYNDYSADSPADKWTQVCAVYDGSGAANADRNKLYLNGINKTYDTMIGTIPATLSSTAGQQNFLSNSSLGLDGVVDNLIIWDRALTAGEITSLYKEPFQMFEKEEIVVNAAAAAPSGQVIMIMMSSIPALLVVGLVGGLVYSGRAA